MDLLDHGEAVGWYTDREIDSSPDPSGRPTEQGGGPRISSPCRAQSPHHVVRVAARGETNDDVAGLDERVDLPFEHPLESVVIPHGREHTGVRCQRYGGQRCSLIQEPPDELGSDMLRGCRAPAVSEQEDASSALERVQNHGGKLIQLSSHLAFRQGLEEGRPLIERLLPENRVRIHH